MVAFSDRSFGSFNNVDAAIKGGTLNRNLKFLRGKADCLVEHKIHLSSEQAISVKFVAAQPDGSLVPVVQKVGFRSKIRKKSV
jgi:hypothetical protein